MSSVTTSTGLSSSVHPHAFYTMPAYPFSPYGNYQLSYGQQQPPTTQWSVPLSTYSSLNGATTSPNSTQAQRSPVQQPQVQSPVLQHHSSPPPQQPQQYQPPPPSQPQPQITIEYVSFNGWCRTRLIHVVSPSLVLANYQTTQSTGSYAPTAYYSYQTHTPPLSLNPSLLHTTPQSPVAHNQPTTPVAGPSMPSKSSLINFLNSLLSSKGLSNSPTQIVRTIMTMGPSEVELSLRLQVLSKIRDCAGNDFYQAWASSLEAMDLIRDWLKAAVTSKTGDWDETVMPLLHVRCYS